MIVYSVEEVTKWYGGNQRPANDALSLEVEEGEIFGILGPNGAGKTTLVEQLVGLLAPSKGAVKLYGREVRTAPELVTAAVGFMPQSAFALNNLTVGEAVYFTGHLRGRSKSGAARERDALLERLGIAGVAGRIARQLSGGQRRLLQLAVAMIGAPPVLVLDEPTSELDPENRRLVWELLREVNRDSSTTVVFITHDAVEAEKIIHRVAIMRDGRVLATGRPAALKATVDRLVRLEVTVPGQRPPSCVGVDWVEINRERWRAYLEAGDVGRVVASLELQDFDDFRLYSATLEDLYLHYAGAA